MNRRTVKSILLVKKFWGLVEMTSGLVNASFSLPEWQAVKMIFFAPFRETLLKKLELFHIVICARRYSFIYMYCIL